jgi:hypothetical protein
VVVREIAAAADFRRVEDRKKATCGVREWPFLRPASPIGRERDF